ncbi:hypothetical protein FJT64_008171 [Amphibalanus amphitrite]|uniref:XRRM domain-containing protein n=1 Tax=Amphibalanus amphitrite TaxID=1232801 RepID=A0A6A4VKF6_AMPAM|nr:hypothetical protein FJT64_008171 [Amphibalanus amphitrite]
MKTSSVRAHIPDRGASAAPRRRSARRVGGGGTGQAPLVASEADVMKAINSFPPSSSAGLDGIRPAHLRSLLTKHTAEAGARLLTALTALTNLALSGRLPECVVPAFFGASLIALRKKDGGLRPIAVGNIREVAMSELELLGAPVHDDQVRRKLLQGQLMVEKLIRRLQALEEAHQAFFLLKSYVSLPRVLYLLRSSPAYRHPALLVKIDETVRCGMEAITNVRLRGDSWRQATLPVNLGGLGVRMVTDVALPAHIASQVASADTIASIYGSAAARVGEATRCLVEEWEAHTGLPSPDVSRQRYQRDWDRAAAEAISRQLLDDCTTDVDRARLRAAAQPHSGAWLNAFPAASVGTLLDPDTLRTAVALRVGAEVCAPHRCRCGADIDERGLHGLSCQLSAGRFPRHAELNSARPVGVAPQFVPGSVVRFSADRPAAASDKQIISSLKSRPGVQYVELGADSEPSYLRMESAAAAAACLKDPELRDATVLTGGDEENYWRRLQEERSATRSRRHRSKERGRDRLLRRLRTSEQLES